MKLASMLARIRTIGFEGPYYRGLLGKARFLFETVAWRTDFIFVATEDSRVPTAPPLTGDLALTTVTVFQQLEKFRAQLEAEYYDGYLDTWRGPFAWGERVVIGTMGGRVAAFAWVQRGTTVGFPTYYGRLFEDEARILRVGVVPTFRRRGLNSAMMHAVLDQLLGEGVRRVFAESHKHNLPSVRTFLKVGFRPVATISVLNVPGERELVRWSTPSDTRSHLRDLGLDADNVAQP
jgi:RimJ/RimL family protein N-acetyltransferase